MTHATPLLAFRERPGLQRLGLGVLALVAKAEPEEVGGGETVLDRVRVVLAKHLRKKKTHTK